jgi:hypothetical protein
MTTDTLSGYMPVRPKVLRFVEWRENLTYGQPLELPGKSPICMFLQSQMLLAFRTIDIPALRRHNPFPVSVEKLGERLHLVLRGHYANPDIFLLLPEIARNFDTFLPSLISEEVLSRTQIGFQFGLSGQMIIDEFLTEVGLDDLIESDAMIKDQFRFRARRKLENNTKRRGRRNIRPTR